MYRDIKLRRWDWLLILGAILSPMTGWRIAKIGPAELLCAVWALGALRNVRFKLNYYWRFFLVFLICLGIGTVICIVKVPQELAPSGLFTWLYLSLIALAVFLQLPKNDPDYNEKLMNRICAGAAFWYLFLFLYSRTISRSFFGAPLWYYARFSGGGTNPHQVAVLLCCTIFWFIRQILMRRQRLRNLALFALTLFLEYQSRSSTGVASIALGLFVTLIIVTVKSLSTRRSRISAVVIECVFGLLIAFALRNKIYQMAYDWVASDPNGLGRFYIWSSFAQMFVKSPIFGLGPGMHAISYSGMKEFHNSYLEIIAATGMVGFLAFLLWTVRTVRILLRGDPYLLPIMVSVYVYSMAGFAFRRLAFWLLITFAVVIAQQNGERMPEDLDRELYLTG